jgi:hypothetical protein
MSKIDYRLLNHFFFFITLRVRVCAVFMSRVIAVRGCSTFNFFNCLPNSREYFDTRFFFFGAGVPGRRAREAPSDSRSLPIRRRRAMYSSMVSIMLRSAKVSNLKRRAIHSEPGLHKLNLMLWHGTRIF